MKLDQKGASVYLGIPERSLESWRYRRIGPSFYRVGKRIVYDESDLAAWLAARRVSTRDSDNKVPVAA